MFHFPHHLDCLLIVDIRIVVASSLLTLPAVLLPSFLFIMAFEMQDHFLPTHNSLPLHTTSMAFLFLMVFVMFYVTALAIRKLDDLKVLVVLLSKVIVAWFLFVIKAYIFVNICSITWYSMWYVYYFRRWFLLDSTPNQPPYVQGWRSVWMVAVSPVAQYIRWTLFASASRVPTS